MFAILERGGEVRAQKINNLSGRMIGGRVRDNVVVGSAMKADEWPGYRSLVTNSMLQSVVHSKGQYVRNGVVHTNGIEGVWSLFKRQVYGVHHHVSHKHLDSYLGEMCYRYSRRDVDEGERMNDLLASVEGRLTYKALTHGKEEVREAPTC